MMASHPNGPTRRNLLMTATAAIALAGWPDFARAEDATARAARWKDLRRTIFGNRAIADGSAIIGIDAPSRALDAALVPVNLSLRPGNQVTGLWFVIDDNPSPLAAHFTFGPKADPRELALRVRVDQYTNMHAVVETADGKLYAATRFIKAAGGCSAPAETEIAGLSDIGRMKLRLVDEFAAGKPVQAKLMIRHPNFNGMQMNQVTRLYTPARFIRSVDVTYNSGLVFHLDSDISLSTDPVIGFGFVPEAKGKMLVTVRDSSKATFRHSFDLPPAAA